MEMEGEIMRQGQGNFARMGDVAAFDIDREVSSHGSTMTNNPVHSVDAQTNFFAQNQHRKSIIDVENEIWNHANVLTPRQRKGKTLSITDGMESLVWNVGGMIDTPQRRTNTTHRRKRR
jgi:hypothetical protein